MQEAYSYGARHFGENYVQELLCKARELKGMMDIQWHYIGRLQKQNAKKLVDVPGLWMVETVSSSRSAQALSQRWGDRTAGENTPLQVMLQVNTSGEESKHGCCPEACVDLAHYVVEECPHLKLCGLMTIGRQRQTVTPNPDFVQLLRCREVLHHQVTCSDLELSMGMTDDYIHAIELGSTNVRIGRAIFSPHV
jgi:pyridoxal phosphate enzyme (YggS family)